MTYFHPFIPVFDSRNVIQLLDKTAWIVNQATTIQ